MQYSAQRMNFQKPLHAIVVLRIDYLRSGREKLHFLPIFTMPLHKTKKRPFFAQLGVIFQSRGRGIAVFKWRYTFAPLFPSPYTELKYVVCEAFWRFRTYRLKYGGNSAGLLRQNHQGAKIPLKKIQSLQTQNITQNMILLSNVTHFNQMMEL